MFLKTLTQGPPRFVVEFWCRILWMGLVDVQRIFLQFVSLFCFKFPFFFFSPLVFDPRGDFDGGYFPFPPHYRCVQVLLESSLWAPFEGKVSFCPSGFAPLSYSLFFFPFSELTPGHPVYCAYFVVKGHLFCVPWLGFSRTGFPWVFRGDLNLWVVLYTALSRAHLHLRATKKAIPAVCRIAPWVFLSSSYVF